MWRRGSMLWGIRAIWMHLHARTFYDILLCRRQKKTKRSKKDVFTNSVVLLLARRGKPCERTFSENCHLMKNEGNIPWLIVVSGKLIKWPFSMVQVQRHVSTVDVTNVRWIQERKQCSHAGWYWIFTSRIIESGWLWLWVSTHITILLFKPRPMGHRKMISEAQSSALNDSPNPEQQQWRLSGTSWTPMRTECNECKSPACHIKYFVVHAMWTVSSCDSTT